jgi:hypothetical protein
MNASASSAMSALRLVHRAHDAHVDHVAVGDLAVHESARDHADHLAALADHGVGERPMRPTPPPP